MRQRLAPHFTSVLTLFPSSLGPPWSSLSTQPAMQHTKPG
jgi:hypothetical protein